MASASYIIVGAGVFGASTALHLSRAHPSASITLIDRSTQFPCALAASWDANKIIRADYGSLFYCELALKAREKWLNDPLYKQFYHQSGMVVVGDSREGRKIVQNYETLKAPHLCEIISPKEMVKCYDGLFADTDYSGIEEVFINPQSGWAEATPAVTRVIETAIKNGVKYVAGNIDTLVFDSSGNCTGVKLSGKPGYTSAPNDDTILSADKVILSTGAGTAKLLADSAPTRKDLQSGDRITAAGVVTGFVQLSDKQKQRFKGGPVFCHAGKVKGGVLPPLPYGLVKFCVDVSFTNISLHKKTGQMISAPPGIDHGTAGQYNIPQTLKEECRQVVQGLYGNELPDIKFWDNFRLCWDGFTPDQDFIISAHPTCQKLYIATGGSFHGWKFLPIIGEYVVQLLDGTLEDDMVKRWAWDRPQNECAHEGVRPRRDLKDLYSQADE